MALRSRALWGFLLVATLCPAPATAASFPDGFFAETVASGLTVPTAFAFLPDGRVLVAEHAGLVRVVEDGDLRPTPLVDLRDRVNNYGDRGLVGMAVDPDFEDNGFLYVLYAYEHNANAPSGTKTARLTRLTVSGNTALPSSEVVVLGQRVGRSCNDFPAGSDCLPADFHSHTGGNIKFAPDGSMFVSTGDGATSRAASTNALRSQDLDSLGGKLLHIDTTGAGLPANPFWNGDEDANRSKVWAYGLRNAWRFNLRPGSGRPYIGDVGWHTFEEIDVATAGANFGWPCYEGNARTPEYEAMATCQALYDAGAEAVEFPLHSYSHSVGNSVTGGVFLSGDRYPSQYRGAYFFGDFAKSFIRYLKVDAGDNLVGNAQRFATDADGPVDIELGPDGFLWYLAINTGELRRIRYDADNHPPVASASSLPASGTAPLAVRLSSAGSSDADDDPLAFSWDFGDGSPDSSLANPVHTYTASGVYDARLTVTDGRGGSSGATVTIRVGRLPLAAITAPLTSLRYRPGNRVTFAGSANDLEDGRLPATALQWTITIVHCPRVGDCHVHPLTTASGATGSFVVPDHEESVVQLTLRATDSHGLTGTASRTIRPALVGSARRDVLTGTSIRDLVFGLTGNDLVLAGAGNDVVFGGAGNDVLNGGAGHDRLEGGRGHDRLYGRTGIDILVGGRGNDRIFTRDRRRDRVNCGRGFDRVLADRHDAVSATCELVARR